MIFERIYDYRDPLTFRQKIKPSLFWYKRNTSPWILGVGFMWLGGGIGLKPINWKPIVVGLIAAVWLANVLALASCAEPPSEPVPPDPFAEFYAIRTTPDWPACEIEGEWLSVGGQYALTPASIIRLNDDGTPRAVYAADYRSDGKEFWAGTPAKEITLRGTALETEIIARMITEQVNGRPGPVESITFKRATQ